MLELFGLDVLALVALFGAGSASLSALLAVGRCYEKCGPNEVLIVSGRPSVFTDPQTGNTARRNFQIFHGGGTFVLPLRERVDRMSVELMTLEIRTPEFFTKFGVPIVVDAIAQIKVMSDDSAAVATAAEMFLSKTQDEMNEIAHQMMQGHLRAVVSTLPFEEMHADPEAFAQSVQRLTAADLANMGIQVVSFTIREVKDPSGYLQALGRPQLAHVKKNAEVGEALAARDAAVGTADAQRQATVSSSKAREEGHLAKLSAETRIAEAEAEKERRQYELRAEVAKVKAQGDVAYEVAKVKAEQDLVTERLSVSRIEIERRIEIENLEVSRRERELAHSITRPAEAEAERLRRIAEAEADAIRIKGLAEAAVMRAKAEVEAFARRAALVAEADGMRAKAAAWENYNAAALSEIFIERLPEIAAAVSKPLEGVERIVMVSTGSGAETGIERLTQGITNVMAQLPAVAGVAGVDLDALMAQLPAMGAQKARESEKKGLEPEKSSNNGVDA